MEDEEKSDNENEHQHGHQKLSFYFMTSSAIHLLGVVAKYLAAEIF